MITVIKIVAALDTGLQAHTAFYMALEVKNLRRERVRLHLSCIRSDREGRSALTR